MTNQSTPGVSQQLVDEKVFSAILRLTRERLGQTTIALTEVEALLEVEREINKSLVERLAKYEPQQGPN